MPKQSCPKLYFSDFLKGTFSGLKKLLAAESPLKIMKYPIYFTSKALFVLKMFKFFLTLWSCKKNSLIRKISLIPKFLTSKPGQQRIAIHIIPNISRSKGKSDDEILVS